jgi:hypothetical protein
VLKKLRLWAYNVQGEKVYWLNGMAGTGKTTIAYSLCEELASTCTLAASFFCSRQLPSCRDVNLILPTIAYQLARFSRPFRYALSRILEQDPDAHSQSLADQFAKMILEPLRQVKHTMPSDVVVVIDALDECDRSDSVSQLLQSLLSNASDLPLKFFVTSRPEPKIIDWMVQRQGERDEFELHLHNIEDSIVKEDIRTYLELELKPARLSGEDLARLVEQAGALFIYASTLVRYIGYDNFKRSPRKRLATMLAVSSSKDSLKDIDMLYGAILTAALGDPKLTPFEMEDITNVLETVLCAKEPLSVSTVAALLGLEDEDSVHSALRSMLSIVHVSDSTGIITTLHASFPDFMFDEERSGRFHCDRELRHGQLARLCFDVMKKPHPPFNICNLGSSYLFDNDVPGIDKVVDRVVSGALFYACRYWGAHIELGEPSPDLVSALGDFLSVRLLLWMEVLNLKRCMHTGVTCLSLVQRWTQVSAHPTDTSPDSTHQYTA